MMHKRENLDCAYGLTLNARVLPFYVYVIDVYAENF